MNLWNESFVYCVIKSSQVWGCVVLSVLAGVASLYGISRFIVRIQNQKQNNEINQTINSNINGSIGFSRAIYFTIGLLLGKGDDEF